MQLFITGTDTNVGKTIVCSWLCLHSAYDYLKPIQSGSIEGKDSEIISALTSAKIHKEIYSYQAPLSPHVGTELEGETIDIDRIHLPDAPNLIIEGAGGVLVPLNSKYLLIDLIQKLQVPTLVVSRSTLGTINHTLLTLEALRQRDIPILGVIMNGLNHPESAQAIVEYGNVSILATLPFLSEVTIEALKEIELPTQLKAILAR